jgi:chromosome segregation ATPase
MTALLRKNADPNATDEFVLPESFKKAAQELKNEQQTITQELEKAKAESVVRKTDESTRVFNLRQHQVVSKIKELEQRKVKAEKELNALLHQKNSKLHEDLKKVTDVLVNETLKIAPFEKELENGMSKISNLKNEMQQFFESSLDERKKSSHFIEDQTREIHQLGELVKGTMNVLEKDLHRMNLDIDKLSMEKIEIISCLGRLKEEVFAKESIIRTCELKREELQQIESVIKHHQKELPAYHEARAKHDFLVIEVEELKNKQTEISASIQVAQQERLEVLSQTSRLEFTLSQVGDQILSRKEALSEIEKVILEAKKRLESTRGEEFDLHRSYQLELVNLTKIRTEISQAEGLRSAALLMQEESFDFYKIKKETYARELELLDVAYQSRVSQLETEYQSKKLQWESEFKVYCEGKENDFKFHLEALDAEDLEEIKKKKSELSSQVVELIVRQSLKEGFSSVGQRSDEARNEVDGIFERLFGRTNRWKFW